MKKFLIADDHALIRKGLSLVLETEFPSCTVTETADAEELLNKVFAENWDVVITDIAMPGRSGLEVLQQIKQHAPGLPILVVSMFPEEQYAIRVLKAGAAGYLNKLSAPEEIIKAIQCISLGKKYITPGIAQQLALNLSKDQDNEMHESLSNRELEIFLLFAAGKTVSGIAKQVKLSPSTISTYRGRIMEKMQFKSNTDIVFYSIAHNLA